MQEKNPRALPDIRHTAVLNATIRKVWEAVATSKGLATWFMPNDFQAKFGYEFTLQTPFGPVPCKVLEVDPPYRLTFAWDEFSWRVTFELKEREGKTQVTLIHSGWGEPDAIIPRASETHAVVRDRMDKGWENLVHNKLREVVEA